MGAINDRLSAKKNQVNVRGNAETLSHSHKKMHRDGHEIKAGLGIILDTMGSEDFLKELDRRVSFKAKFAKETKDRKTKLDTMRSDIATAGSKNEKSRRDSEEESDMREQEKQAQNYEDFRENPSSSSEEQRARVRDNDEENEMEFDSTSDVPADKIEEGAEIEEEHGPTYRKIKTYYEEHGEFPPFDLVTEWIAVDHLQEFSDYYDALDKMEEELKKAKKKAEAVRRVRAKNKHDVRAAAEKTIDDYSDYDGVDASLEVSLFEYGLIWKERETDYHFIYGVSIDENGNYNLFDCGDIDKKVNPEEEWRFADFNAVADFTGMTKEAFLKQPIPMIVEMLLAYYGYENIFGSSYAPFEIINEEQREKIRQESEKAESFEKSKWAKPPKGGQKAEGRRVNAMKAKAQDDDDPERADIINDLVGKFGERWRKTIEATLEIGGGRYGGGEFIDPEKTGRFVADGWEWNYFVSEAAAEKAALEIIKNDLEDNPEIFDPDWLSHYLSISDTDRRIFAQEDADAKLEDISDEDVFEELGENPSEDEKEIEDARNRLYEKIVEDIYARLEDPVEYFIHDIGMYRDVADMMKHLGGFILIDIETAAQDLLDTDGWAHFLSLYDGNYKEVGGGGIVFFRETRDGTDEGYDAPLTDKVKKKKNKAQRDKVQRKANVAKKGIQVWSKIKRVKASIAGEAEEAIRDYWNKRMSKRAKDIVGALTYDLYYGVGPEEEIYPLGKDGKPLGWRSALEELRDIIDELDGFQDLWYDAQGGEVLENEPRGYKDEDGEWVEPMWDDIHYFEAGDVKKIVLGDELARHV